MALIVVYYLASFADRMASVLFSRRTLTVMSMHEDAIFISRIVGITVQQEKPQEAIVKTWLILSLKS